MGQWLVQWVAWRTLRTRVEKDGSLDGRPMYRVGGVRMVLSSDGRAFTRVVACSRCARLRASHRLVREPDLHAGTMFDLCAECAPTDSRPMDLGGVSNMLSDEDDGNRSSPPGIE